MRNLIVLSLCPRIMQMFIIYFITFVSSFSYFFKILSVNFYSQKASRSSQGVGFLFIMSCNEIRALFTENQHAHGAHLIANEYSSKKVEGPNWQTDTPAPHVCTPTTHASVLHYRPLCAAFVRWRSSCCCCQCDERKLFSWNRESCQCRLLLWKLDFIFCLEYHFFWS